MSAALNTEPCSMCSIIRYAKNYKKRERKKKINKKKAAHNCSLKSSSDFG